ncbi:MAG: hypothetical protein AAF449_03365 [Myxococcota bacterium]
MINETYKQRKQAWARQQMLQDLKETQSTESVRLDMKRWRRWITGVTEYSSIHATCVWNGKDVFIDAEAPYVTKPDSNFPVERHIQGKKLYHAWPIDAASTPQPSVFSETETGA